MTKKRKSAADLQSLHEILLAELALHEILPGGAGEGLVEELCLGDHFRELKKKRRSSESGHFDGHESLTGGRFGDGVDA